MKIFDTIKLVLKIRKKLNEGVENMDDKEKEEIAKTMAKLNTKETSKSGSFSLSTDDWGKIRKSILLGACGFAVAFIPQIIGVIPAGWWTPIIAAGVPVIINSAHKYLKNNQE